VKVNVRANKKVISMIIVGIDTDAKGSIAILDCRSPLRGTLDVYAIPNRLRTLRKGTKRIEVDYPVLVATMVELISNVPVDKIYLEEQWARKGDGLVGAFSFGRTYGEIRTAVVAGLVAKGVSTSSAEKKLVFVPGGDWKLEMQLDKDKQKSINLANVVFPKCGQAWKLKKHISAAEASLIALWGASKEGVRLQGGVKITPPARPWLRTIPSLVFPK
jgi:hypothetical protein